jgi:hypothetical protein
MQLVQEFVHPEGGYMRTKIDLLKLVFYCPLPTTHFPFQGGIP